MALDSANVRVAVSGAIFVGDSTAVAPTDADAPPGTGWNDLGYASENGVVETRNRSSNTIRGWQNGDVLREVITEASIAYQFTLVETKPETIELYYATTVAADGSIIIVPSKTGGRRPYIIDVIDGDDFIRAYIPSGEITEVGDQTYANGEAIGYEVTVRAYPLPSLLDGDGNTGSVEKWYSSLSTNP
jgi:hypothetical protein